PKKGEELWNDVRRSCVGESAPKPGDYCIHTLPTSVVVRDIFKQNRLLLVPSVAVSGIDDPAVPASSSPHHWHPAWSSRSLLPAKLGGGRPALDDVAVAINSACDRSQGQLHIHIGCLRKDVREMLTRLDDKIDGRWLELPRSDQEQASLMGQYRARRFAADQI